ncbi:cyclin-O [Misgurnus anguillicaudatus]|uniref:cyclin-O n=1 Tax=Misgurnus anguillicaudatus TaxID=75329 RepID=UPI003CCF0541
MSEMSTLSDSGFEEDLQTSPVNQWEVDSSIRLTSDWHEAEYKESCFLIQRQNELQFLVHDCLANQPQINPEARSRLVSWLIAVQRQLKLSFESCCLAVNIMDRFLITTSVATDCFQLLGVTSLLIATKQVEVNVPRVKELLLLCCNSFTRQQLYNLECLILLRLNFRLAAPTLAFFLDYFTSQSIHEYQSCGARDAKKQNFNEKWKCLSCKVCEMSLADYTFNKYIPSVIVQCAIKLAKDLLKNKSKDSSITESSKTFDSFSFEDYPLHTCENQVLFQQCTDELKLMVFLNQEAVQEFISL